MNKWNDQLDLLIKSRTPLILIRSKEEERVEILVQEATKRLSNRRLAIWDYVDGLKGILNSDGLGSRQPMAILEWLQKVDSSLPTILLAKDFNRFSDDAGISRMLINLSAKLRNTPHTIILIASNWSPSSDLAECLTILDLPKIPKGNTTPMQPKTLKYST